LTLSADDAVANLNKSGDLYANTTYTAKFVPDETKTYTVTYAAQANGSTDPTSQSDQVLSNSKITGSTATASTGYAFDGWYKDSTLIGKINGGKTLRPADAKANLNKNGDLYANTTYTAHFDKDDNHDDIPDKYQVVVTFKVVNGKWNDDTAANKTVYVTLLDANGDYSTNGSGKLTAGQIPAVGGKPANGYTAGAWDKTPNITTAISSAMTYTYTYAANPGPGQQLTLITNDRKRDYNGLPLYATAIANIADAIVDYSIEGGPWINLTGGGPSRTDVGETKVQFRARYGNQTVYRDAKITIDPKALTITGDGWDEEQKYTGEEYSKNTYTVTGLVAGETLNVTYSISGTDKGDYTGTFSTPVVLKANGNVSTGNYNITTTPGTLTIGEPPFAKVEPGINDDPPGTDPTGPGDLGENDPKEPITIRDPETPLAGAPVWALLNLILGIATAVVGAAMGISLAVKPKQDEAEAAAVRAGSEEEDKKRKWTKLLGIIPALAAIITFLLTEDMSAKMVIVDKWTILMAIYAVAGGALAYFTRNKKDEKKEEEKA
ncbi:MAG: InlB B-repeat-containing protein, partial [Oscillospiraceae bacterium]|nr:InlB B-repeat-containing protein [Oscillospiraceae bacterium]